jgi:hypothetical protein
METRAADAERAAEARWRARVEAAIVSSAWAGGKSRLEQLVERQQGVVAALEEAHGEKIALARANHGILRRNLRATLHAERRKVGEVVATQQTTVATKRQYCSSATAVSCVTADRREAGPDTRQPRHTAQEPARHPARRAPQGVYESEIQ